MTEVIMTECDQCGKKAEDRYDEPGWIRLESTGDLRITYVIKARGEDPHTNFKTVPVPFDFCGRPCLEAWFEAFCHVETPSNQKRKRI